MVEKGFALFMEQENIIIDWDPYMLIPIMSTVHKVTNTDCTIVKKQTERQSKATLTTSQVELN